MSLINVIITNLFLLRILMKKYDFKDDNYVTSDPVESYFECISSCDISDGICISKCVEILREDNI